MARDEWIGLALVIGLVAVALYMRRITATQRGTETPQPTGEKEMPSWARQVEGSINWALQQVSAAKYLYEKYHKPVENAVNWLYQAAQAIGKAISDILSGLTAGAQLASTAAGAPSVVSPGVQMVAT